MLLIFCWYVSHCQLRFSLLLFLFFSFFALRPTLIKQKCDSLEQNSRTNYATDFSTQQSAVIL